MTDQPLSDSQLLRLERLVQLRDKGALSEAEFESQKQALLTAPAGDAVGAETAPTPPPSHGRGMPGIYWALAGILLAAILVFLIWGLRPGSARPETASSAPDRTAPSSNSSVGVRAPTPKAAVPDVPPVAPQNAARAVFPSVFRGRWGRSIQSCAGQDDYGPLEVATNSYTYYEAYGTLARPPRMLGPRSIELRFRPDEEEPNPAPELWTLNRDGSLTMASADGSNGETFRRCPSGSGAR